MSDARREAETTARYLLGVADETRLGEFEEELVECIRALLAEQPLAPPPAPCGGRCEDALDSRSPCQSCAERLARAALAGGKK